MFYLCSIGSNLDPHIHVRNVLEELLARFGPLQLSSVIRTKPVDMHSRHDFLNCLLVLESKLDAAALKQTFVALEIAQGRDRSDPHRKVRDRPLDIDILASSPDGDFSTAQVNPYLTELLTELYRRGEVQDPKVELQVHLPRGTGKTLEQQVGLVPTILGTMSERGQTTPPVHLDAGPRHVTVLHQ